MHHKRRRPKQQRSGCLYCKPWKGNHAKSCDKRPVSDRRRTPRVDDVNDRDAA